MSFKPVLPSQYKLLQSKAKLTIVACEPGAGTTYGLLLKALHEAQNSEKFILFIGTYVDKNGNVIDTFTDILKDQQYRYSKVSRIFTFPSGGRVKFASFSDTDAWIGCRFDYIICDHRFHCLDYLTMFKVDNTVVSAYPDVIVNDLWFKAFYKDGVFEDFVDLIKFKSEENTMFDNVQYLQYAREGLPEHFGFKF